MKLHLAGLHYTSISQCTVSRMWNPVHFPIFLKTDTRRVYAVRVNNMEKKINPFNYLHSDIQFDELLPHLLRSLFVSPSLLKVALVCVCVCVCVCVWIFFLRVRSTYQSLVPIKQASVWNIYMLEGRWWWQNLCQNTHQTPWDSKPLYTPSKIIQKALRPLIFFTLHFIEFRRRTNTFGHTEPGCFCMLSISEMFVETEVVCKWHL